MRGMLSRVGAMGERNAGQLTQFLWENGCGPMQGCWTVWGTPAVLRAGWDSMAAGSAADSGADLAAENLMGRAAE